MGDLTDENDVPWPMTSIVNAALGLDAAAVQAQITAGADVNCSDYGKQTALMVAARHGHEKLVTLLLNSRADVNAADLVHSTALHEAVGAGSEVCARMLIEAHADIRMRTLEGETAICRAQRRGHVEIALMLEAHVCQGRWAPADPGALRKLCT